LSWVKLADSLVMSAARSSSSVEILRKDARLGQIGARRRGRKVYALHDLQRSPDDGRRQGGEVRRLPDVYDDAMALTEHAGEGGQLQQRQCRLPRGVHRLSEPLPRLAEVVGQGAQVAFEARDLGRLPFAFHEEDAVLLDGRRFVQVVAVHVTVPAMRHRSLDGPPPIGEGLEHAGCLLEGECVPQRDLRIVLLMLAMVSR